MNVELISKNIKIKGRGTLTHFFLSSILADNTDAIKYVILGLLALSVITTIVKKLFKLALILALVAIAAYYFVPGVVESLALPPMQ